MMTSIKIGIAFLLGMVYLGCFWIFYEFFSQQYLWLLIVALAVGLIITILAIAGVLTFFIKNWHRR
jgi:hypothetical protein